MTAREGQAWIFQANPDRYDIDRALGDLQVIHWRVPQYASEIQPGDIAVIWRSGRDAGIVGLGRVCSHPREAPAPEVEVPYNVGDEEGGVETRVVLNVRPVDHISKEEVAKIPAMSDHSIVTAPMGTVFRLDGEERSALTQRLPEPPPTLAVDELGDDDTPPAFAWSDRGKSVAPLPGGIDQYVSVLRSTLSHVRATQPEERDLIDWVSETFSVSESRSRNTVKFLQRLSLLRRSAARLDTTSYADRWLETEDNEYLLALIHSRVQLIGELLVFLEEPRTPEDLLEFANAEYGMSWSTRAQVDRRRALLGGLGAVTTTEDGKLTATALGRRVRDRVEIAETRREDVTPPGETERDEEEAAVSQPATGRAISPEVEELVRQLELTSHDSSNPDAFERATRDAFSFLGFDAEWVGGAGNTDVLLVAPLARDDRYRVIVDTKSTSHEAVSDAQIDWETLDEHKDRYEADYVALVAPAFKSGRLEERATAKGRLVVLIDVPALAELLRQHDLVPLDLLTYRRLFESQGGPEDVGENADEERRAFLLAEQILNLVNEIGQTEGQLSARDLYWNIEVEDDDTERPSVEEIDAIARGLAAPPFRLLRQDGDRYRPIGTPDTVALRLKVLAGLLERQAGPDS